MLVARLSVQRCAISVRQFKTSALKPSEAKTPVQSWGYQYLKNQKALNRPIAPHLTIYKPQLTWVLSGAHRICGCLMGGTLLLGGIGFMVGPVSYAEFIEYFRGLPAVVTAPFKFFISFNIVFYALNGLRLVGFDLAKGTDLPTVYKSGWAVLGLSVLISLLVVAASAKKEK
ncbi:unnamed protein product [Bursaphelenchus xylophilus]|uniref:(pine wood nematode) hypothetical protein n=1 Tax=Bursaphelenchus xylophilus TaxID=6326 RepID=A0A1I7S038_BURXY|nr:unnamed protein product [Bursaphelenchus xylophilus]CAG9109040.1 unnamed protein product [Bursaphelenchus xylophilus]